MSTKRFLQRIALLLAAATTVSPQSIWAQATAQATAQTLDTATIEAVIVTARKREESIRDVPIAVTAVTAADIEKLGANALDEVGRAIPNVQFGRSGTGSQTAQIFIRGVGQRDYIVTSDPGVGVYIDGVYMARPDGQLLSTLDVERIEVLRGPQGTLFGKNNIGGAVNVISAKPEPDLAATVSGEVGNFGTFGGRVMLNLPLVDDRLLSRFAISHRESDGYAENPQTGQNYSGDETSVATAALRWVASDSVKMDIAGDWSESNSAGRAARCVYPRSGTPIPYGEPVAVFNQPTAREVGWNFAFNHPNSPFFAGTTSAQACADAAALGDYKTAETGSISDISTYGARGTVSWDVRPDLTLKLINGYSSQTLDQYWDMDRTRLPGADIRFINNKFTQSSHELQAVGTAGSRFAYVTGFYYFQEDSDGPTNQQFATLGNRFEPLAGAVVPVFGTRLSGRNDIDNSSWAVYGQGSFDITPSWNLTAGVRYTHDSKGLYRYQETITPALTMAAANGFPAISQPAAVRVDANADVKRDYSQLTPMVSIKYDFGDSSAADAMVYLSYAQGFKSGGWNGRGTIVSGNLTSYEEETVDSYELGAKWTPGGGRLQLSAAIFHLDYSDIQLLVNRPSGTALVVDTLNAARPPCKAPSSK